MKILVENLYDETVKTIEGPAQAVELELLRLYPFLNHHDPRRRGTVQDLVRRLNRVQILAARVEDAGSEPIAKAEPRNLTGADQHVIMAMMGHNARYARALAAARFLAARPEPDRQLARQALWEADGDVEEAALRALGLEASEGNRKALRAVQDVSKVSKAEAQPADNVSAADPDGDDVAEAVRRAAADNFLLPVKLGGKHSLGSVLARDQETGETWLLKPGSGGPGPAAGAKEEQASPSRREAAFYHVAEAWGLGQHVPRAELLLFHGPGQPVTEVAAIKLLGWDYRTLDALMEAEPDAGRKLLAPYLSQGLLHRWGVLDYVLGNVDRHAGNLMVRGADVQLIDHGSSMAGPDFDPARDRKSFVPFYLRAWTPGRWSQLQEQDRLKYMPRLSEAEETDLKTWLEELRDQDLDKILGRYGVNPEPARARLARLRMLAASGPADVAVCRAWVET